MTIAPLPANESSRLAALRALDVLDTPPESHFDDLTQLAASLCGTPIALVSLVDDCRQWFKSRYGLDATEPPRDLAFSAYAILGTDLFEVPDAKADVRFTDNPLVTSPAGVRFYAGAPLTLPDGHIVGTLSVLDRVPRKLSDGHREALRVLARQVVAQLLLRRQMKGLHAHIDTQDAEHQKFRVLFEHSSDAHLLFHEHDGIIDCNHAAVEMLRCRDKSEVLALHPAVLSPEFQPDGRRSLEKCVDMDATARREGYHRFDWTHRRADGENFPCEVTLTPVDLRGRAVLLVVWHDLTDRKRAEDALRESEQRFRSVVDRLAEGVVLLDRDTRRVVRANPAFLELLGYTADEMAALTQYDFVAHDRADIDSKMNVVQSDGQHYLGVRSYLRKDRTRLNVTVSGSLLALDRKPVLCLLVRDVTAEKRAEDALRASEALLGGAFEDAAIGMALVAPDGRWLRVNRSLSAFLGYLPAELLATDFQTLTHPEDLDADFALLRQVLAGEVRTYHIEKRYFHKGGRTLHALLSVSLVRDAAGAPLYFVSQIKDIGPRKAAEQALRASELKFRLVVDRLAEGMFVLDCATSRFIEVNVAMQEMLGYTADEFLALSLSELLAGGSPEMVARELAGLHDALAKHGRHDMGRKYLRRKDGSDLPVEVRVSLVPTGGAGLHAFIVRDVTEQVAAEDRLFEYQLSLEEANAKLKSMATTDGLTGVKNRAAFNGRLEEEYDRATRYHHPLSVVLMDVDHFKQFNDTFGHPAGDEVLRVVAKTLRQAARTTDYVARYGGEEFVVLLPDTDLSGALVVAERLRRAIAAGPWDKRSVTVSVGVATLTPSTTDAGTLIQEADEALYRSKEAGRNRVLSGSQVVPRAALTRQVEKG